MSIYKILSGRQATKNQGEIQNKYINTWCFKTFYIIWDVQAASEKVIKFLNQRSV